MSLDGKKLECIHLNDKYEFEHMTVSNGFVYYVTYEYKNPVLVKDRFDDYAYSYDNKYSLYRVSTDGTNFEYIKDISDFNYRYQNAKIFDYIFTYEDNIYYSSINNDNILIMNRELSEPAPKKRL